MTTRRRCNPEDVQNIWNVLSFLNYQKVSGEFNKMLRELVLNYGRTLSEWENIASDAIIDGLITKLNNETNCYRFPEEQPLWLEEKDGYCFECHKAGSILDCRTENCHRVFHENCVTESMKRYELIKNYLTNNKSVVSLKTVSTPANKKRKHSTQDIVIDYDKNVCILCNINKLECKKFPRDEFNHFLGFLYRRIKSWLPLDLTHKMAGSEEFPVSVTQLELEKRAKLFFFNPIEMSVIRNKVYIQKQYTECQEFLGDILDIQHNVGIFHGNTSQEFKAAEYILNDTLYDLGEIMCCADCYAHSNEKINENWFCLPCKNKHQLVWAKQRGFPYWPAKVLNETETHVDVRFFGGKHERAYLSKQCIKPISENLKLKMSVALKKALAELELHKEISSDTEALRDFVNNSKTNDAESGKVRGRSCTPVRRASLQNRKLSDTPLLCTRSKSLDRLDVDLTASFELPSKSYSRKRPFPNASETPKRGRPRKKSGTEVTNPTFSYKNKRSDSRNTSLNSDCGDVYAFNGNDVSTSTDNDGNDQVTSSTELRDSDDVIITGSYFSQNAEIQELKRKMLRLSDKQDLIACAMECVQKLNEQHKEQISRTKKRQWCYYCEQDAIYHCCWNTAYCSTDCQQKHWDAEHKKVCRRKR